MLRWVSPLRDSNFCSLSTWAQALAHSRPITKLHWVREWVRTCTALLPPEMPINPGHLQAAWEAPPTALALLPQHPMYNFSFILFHFLILDDKYFIITYLLTHLLFLQVKGPNINNMIWSKVIEKLVGIHSSQTEVGWILAQSLCLLCILVKLLSFSMPQFPHV